MKLKTVLFLLIFLGVMANGAMAQKRGNVWCFGHQAAIDFSSGQPVADSSAVISRGSCASICDTSGKLLFYAAYDTIVFLAGSDPVKVYGSDHQIITNGDSIKGGGWYYELVIIPDPGDINLYYLFNIGVTLDYGIYYSVIDISLNGGLGGVIQKNVQLQSFKCSDGLTAIKHGNGRDWWVFFKDWSTPNNIYFSYLITPNGVSSVTTQQIGTTTSNGFARMAFSRNGEKMMFWTLEGLMELFDFDRCTGLLSNHQIIFPAQTGTFSRFFWAGAFSPSGELFYTTLIADPFLSADSCFLIQYNLNALDVAASADTLQVGLLMNNMGDLKLGADSKIYMSTKYNNLITNSYPLPDSVYSVYNSNLSVINYPDSLAAACNYQPYSFNLNGGRSYVGLPNNPDYDLGPLAGSPCDTLLGIGEAPQMQQTALNVFFHTAWEKAFINASNLKGKTGKLLVYDMQGKVIHSESLRIQNGYYTRDLSMAGFSDGMYLVVVATEKERLTKKVVVE